LSIAPGIALKRPTGKYIYLLAALLLLFVVSPVAEDYGVGYAVLDASSTVILLATIFAIAGERRPMYFAVPLAAVTLLANWVGYALHDGRIYIVATAAYSLFFLFAAGHIIRGILKEKRVTWDVVLGGVSGYLLIGLTFANLFTTIGLIHPGAFAGVHESGPITAAPTSSLDRDTDLIYFSFTTLTTLGYGDVLPVAHLARHMAALEGILGQIYLAVFVARLVGLHIVHSTTRSE
jgi:voltage-gated potassium channel